MCLGWNGESLGKGGLNGPDATEVGMRFTC